MSYNIAIVGATGNVGMEMMNILAEREFPVADVHAIASRRSVGREVSFGDKILKCQDLETFDFSTVDFVLMSAGGETSKVWSPKIGKMGPIVIDNSSAFRYDGEVPLIVPEVNAHVLEEYMARNDRKNIIANPNCSTAQLVVALKPLHDAARSSASWLPPTSRYPVRARQAWTSCSSKAAPFSLATRSNR